jgi:hypothetical protein
MAEVKPSQISVSIALKELKCIHFSMTDYAIKNESEIDFNAYRYEFVAHTKLDNDKEYLIINFITKLFDKIGADGNLLAEIETETSLHIQNYKTVVTKVGDILTIPDQVVSLTAVMALSNTRGMLSLKLEKTLYSNALIPLVDTAQFVQAKSTG